MSGAEGNRGIIISGGTVDRSTVVAGHHNTVGQYQAAADGDRLAQARADAGRLVDLLAGGGYDFADLPVAHANAIGLQEELGTDEPDPGRLRRWLDRLTALVARVAPLAEIVVAIEESLRLASGA